MRVIFFMVAAMFVFSLCYGATGAVLDNNNGSAGNILVNTGVKCIGQDVGTWVSPEAVPSLKGATGEQGEQGIEGEKGDTGERGSDAECEKRHTPVGVGLDVLLWQSTNKAVGLETQYKYDVRNEEHSIFGVVKLSLPEFFRK